MNLIKFDYQSDEHYIPCSVKSLPVQEQIPMYVFGQRHPFYVNGLWDDLSISIFIDDFLKTDLYNWISECCYVEKGWASNKKSLHIKINNQLYLISNTLVCAASVDYQGNKMNLTFKIQSAKAIAQGNSGEFIRDGIKYLDLKT